MADKEPTDNEPEEEREEVEPETAEEDPRDPDPRPHAADSADLQAEGEIASLGAELKLDGLKSVEILPLPQGYLVLGILEERVLEREELARQITSHGLARNVALYPVLYTPEELAALDQAVPRQEWRKALAMELDPTRVLELYRSHRSEPRAIRELLVTRTQHQLGLLRFVQHNRLLPPYMVLGLARSAVHDALTFLFATRGLEARDPARALRELERHFVGTGFFSREHLLVYLRLCAAERQARHHFMLTGDDREEFELLPLVRAATGFLQAFEGYVRAQFATAAEQRRTRIKRRALWAGVPLALALLVGAYVVSTWPESPVSAAKITKPGGIVGHYFKGIKFERELLVRTDSRIDFNTSGRLADKLPVDFFSVRWNGYLRFPEGGKRVLCTMNDDGAKVWFNNRLVIDDWKGGAARQNCVNLRLKAAWYPLKIDYYDHTHGAQLRLLRGEDKDHLQSVPPQDLCCRGPDDKKPATKPGSKVVAPSLVPPRGEKAGILGKAALRPAGAKAPPTAASKTPPPRPKAGATVPPTAASKTPPPRPKAGASVPPTAASKTPPPRPRSKAASVRPAGERPPGLRVPVRPGPRRPPVETKKAPAAGER